jgi:NAD(P)-dependent dehydrogenase (short-subunit alcohol dehydrogenase family)
MSEYGITADLEDRVAVVIGGTAGIGREIAEALAQASADVVPTSRTESSVEDAAAAVGSDLVCPTDVTERGDVRHLFERTVDELGAIDVLVNSAGIVQEGKRVGEIDDEEWAAIVDTNLYGVFVASQLVPDYMSDRSDRSILNVGSMNGVRPLHGMTAYVASKFGVTGLTQNFAIEYASRDIRVNAIAPGYVKTRQNADALEASDTREAIHGRTPLSRYATLEELAGSALYMVSPAAGFVTGETLVIDGGYTIR